jgi:hypothetical protein
VVAVHSVTKEHSFKVLPELFVRASRNDGSALIYTEMQAIGRHLDRDGHGALWVTGHANAGTTERIPWFEV